LRVVSYIPMKSQKIDTVFLDRATLGPSDLSPLEKLVGSLKTYEITDEEDVASRIRNAEVVITNKVKLNGKNLLKAKRLKLICLAATGTDNVDLDYCREAGILVKNVSAYSTTSVAQHTLNLLLSYVHNNHYFYHYTSSKEWCRSPIFTHLEKTFFEINNQSWGIIGLGAIGQKTASLAEAFGAYISYFTFSERESEYTKMSLDSLLASSKIISIHCKYTKDSHHLLNRNNLKYCEHKPIIINVARGATVDEYAMAEALRSGRVEAYLTDVLSQEPPAEDHPLLAEDLRDRVIMTPHIAWASEQARIRLLNGIINNIKEAIC